MTETFCFSCVHQIEDNYKQKRLGGYTSDNYKIDTCLLTFTGK